MLVSKREKIVREEDEDEEMNANVHLIVGFFFYVVCVRTTLLSKTGTAGYVSDSMGDPV